MNMLKLKTERLKVVLYAISRRQDANDIKDNT
jgi:hypothetical protein